MTDYTFRPATAADYDFLYELHRAALGDYIEALWGWNETWQRDYFAKKFNPARNTIIVVEGIDAGVLTVESGEQEMYLALIELLPAFQRRGVGTAIISSLIRAAAENDQRLTLHVLQSNKPARRLYERLGFVTLEEESWRLRMVYRPQT